MVLLVTLKQEMERHRVTQRAGQGGCCRLGEGAHGGHEQEDGGGHPGAQGDDAVDRAHLVLHESVAQTTATTSGTRLSAMRSFSVRSIVSFIT